MINPDIIDLNCKGAARLMSQRQDRTLTPIEQESLKQHLYECLNCTRFDRQLSFLKKLAEQYAGGGAERK
jgi:hypothetical protein